MQTLISLIEFSLKQKMEENTITSFEKAMSNTELKYFFILPGDRFIQITPTIPQISPILLVLVKINPNTNNSDSLKNVRIKFLRPEKKTNNNSNEQNCFIIQKKTEKIGFISKLQNLNSIQKKTRENSLESDFKKKSTAVHLFKTMFSEKISQKLIEIKVDQIVDLLQLKNNVQKTETHHFLLQQLKIYLNDFWNKIFVFDFSNQNLMSKMKNLIEIITFFQKLEINPQDAEIMSKSIKRLHTLIILRGYLIRCF